MIVSPSAYVAARGAARERSTENLVDLEQVMRRLLFERRLDLTGRSALVAVRDELKDREVTVPELNQRGRGRRAGHPAAGPRTVGVSAQLIIVHGWPGLAVVVAMRPCSVCGEPVDLETAHYPHRDDCPNLIQGVEVVCDCDLVTHPLCCPNCQVMGEALYDRLVALALGPDGEGRL